MVTGCLLLARLRPRDFAVVDLAGESGGVRFLSDALLVRVDVPAVPLDFVADIGVGGSPCHIAFFERLLCPIPILRICCHWMQRRALQILGQADLLSLEIMSLKGL